MYKSSSNKVSILFLATGILLLFCGYLLYLLFRPPAAIIAWTLPLADVIQAILPDAAGRHSWAGWAPSFIHVLSFSLITAGLVVTGRRAWFAIPSGWFLVSVAFELGQKYRVTITDIAPGAWTGTDTIRLIDAYFRFGTFDPADVAAAVAGALVAGAALYRARGMSGIPAGNRFRIGIRYVRPVLISLVFAFGVLCTLATSTAPTCDYEPVYLSYEDLRQPIVGTDPQPVSGGGKIYVYGNYLFVNELNKGIHVIDNTDPQSPVNLQFIPIPGNIDIAVKDNILYADSYIDLVAIDVSDAGNVHEVKRVQDAFMYDPYQNVTDPSVYLCSYDEGKGVVISVRRKQ